jgi:hypothetical protein
MNISLENRKRVEDFFNRDNKAEGVEHYTTFNHIPENIVKYLIQIWKL